MSITKVWSTTSNEPGDPYLLNQPAYDQLLVIASFEMNRGRRITLVKTSDRQASFVVFAGKERVRYLAFGKMMVDFGWCLFPVHVVPDPKTWSTDARHNPDDMPKLWNAFEVTTEPVGDNA